MRFYNEPPKGIGTCKNLASNCLTVSLFSLFIISIIFAFFSSFFSNLFFGKYSVVLLVLLLADSLFLLVMRYFSISARMQNNILLFTVQSILLQFFNRLFCLFGAAIDHSLKLTVLFNVAGLGIFSTVFFFLYKNSVLPKKFQFDFKAFSPVLIYGLGLAPAAILNWGNSLFAKLYVTKALGSSQNGIFSSVALLSFALAVVQGGFNTYWSAYMYKNYRQKQKEITRVHDFVMLGTMVLMTALIAAAPLIFLFVGREFRFGRSIFGLMLFSPMLLIISETTVYGIEISKKTIYNTLGMLLSFISNILLCIIFIPTLGVVGAALSLTVSALIMFIFRTVVAQNLYRTIENPIKSVVSILLMAVLCIISFLFSDSLSIVTAASLLSLVFYLILYRREVVSMVGIIKSFVFQLRRP
ncbi:MAG: hypothetical protein GX928_04325 [Ruminococcaceae bacterium]|nr:hypothetical protein [Oscillospiraceae bacterium]